MKKSIVISAAIAMVSGITCLALAASADHSQLQTVKHVDLNRYVGEWYEIAHYPNRFQKRCVDSTARYSLREDGEIDVLNVCRDEQDGTSRQAKGRAWVVDSDSNARLKVSFFWPFRGDYWIIDLGKNYEYSVIGTPNRKYLWILSRTPVMNSEVFENILQYIEKQGYDRKKLLMTSHTRLQGASGP